MTLKIILKAQPSDIRALADKAFSIVDAETGQPLKGVSNARLGFTAGGVAQLSIDLVQFGIEFDDHHNS